MRGIVLSFGCVAAVLTLPSGVSAAEPTGAAKYRVYVGTYSGGASKGIYLLELDSATGALTSRGLAAESVNPSFLAIRPDRRFLYAVGENSGSGSGGQQNGSVSSFTIDPASGTLSLLNQESSGGQGPCYITIDRTGKFALVANYNSGSVASLPIGPEGRLGPAASTVQHQGASVDPQRQHGPHAHSINLDAANRFAIAADLGLDKLLVYRFDTSQGVLTPNDPPFTAVAHGAGPRHFAFHPDGRHAYVINEMHCTVTAFTYDADRGTLAALETVSTLPTGPKAKNYSTAEVQVHPSGRFLYGSNRGHNTIAIFAIDTVTGGLRLVGHQSTLGKTPRNFGIDPTGSYLLAANQDSGTVVVFRINTESGRLQPIGQTVDIPKPVCVKFVPLGNGE